MFSAEQARPLPAELLRAQNTPQDIGIPAVQIGRIAIAKAIGAPQGRTVAINFYASRKGTQKRWLPSNLTVGINGRPEDARETGHGIYTVFKAFRTAPEYPAVFDAGSGRRITPGRVKESPITVKPVPCVPDCKSLVFGTRCYFCVEVSM